MGADVDMPTVECWLHYRGTVLCVPTTVYTPMCEADHTWWPYDSMRCALQIAPWAHSNDEVELKLTEFGAEGQVRIRRRSTDYHFMIMQNNRIFVCLFS